MNFRKVSLFLQKISWDFDKGYSVSVDGFE